MPYQWWGLVRNLVAKSFFLWQNWNKLPFGHLGEELQPEVTSSLPEIFPWSFISIHKSDPGHCLAAPQPCFAYKTSEVSFYRFHPQTPLNRGAPLSLWESPELVPTQRSQTTTPVPHLSPQSLIKDFWNILQSQTSLKFHLTQIFWQCDIHEYVFQVLLLGLKK